ncbi:MAG: HAD family hydrolase [Candidatus Shapirobacteria bacterium]
MFKNIVFDWSGVINDNAYAVYQSVMAIFDFLKVEQVSFEEFKREWRQPYMDFYHKYIPNMDLTQELKDIYLKNILKYDQNKSFSGIVDLIKKFKDNGSKVFVITSDLPETIANQLKAFGLEGIFDEVVVESHNKTSDLESLVKKYQMKLNETVFIGDSNHEIESGQKIGTKTISVTWGFCLEETLKSYNPDYMAHNLTELENIILKSASIN